jgi:hypothetical protein
MINLELEPTPSDCELYRGLDGNRRGLKAVMAEAAMTGSSNPSDGDKARADLTLYEAEIADHVTKCEICKKECNT